MALAITAILTFIILVGNNVFAANLGAKPEDDETVAIGSKTPDYFERYETGNAKIIEDSAYASASSSDSNEGFDKDYYRFQLLKQSRKRRSPTYLHSGYGLNGLHNGLGLYQNPGYVKPVQVIHQQPQLQPVYYYEHQQQQPYTVHHYVGSGKDVVNTQQQTQTQSQAISASFGGSSISGAAASAASSSNTDQHQLYHHQPNYVYGHK